jgi:3-oxoacyl-[acyl-carrier-protein] synthase III
VLNSNNVFRSRIESIGTYLPSTVVTTRELVASISGRSAAPPVEELTGVVERRVCSRSEADYEDSYILARNAINDCLSRSRYSPDDVDIVISTSITRTKNRSLFSWEPSFASMLARDIGAKNVIAFDIGNACAGMVTGVMVLDRMIRHGVVRTGIVVSGEQITPAAENAVLEMSETYDPQFASLSVGDAGAAVVIDRATDDGDFIDYVDLMTSAGYAEFCLGMPSDRRQGVAMYTDNRSMQNENRYLQGIYWYLDSLASRGRSFLEEGFDFIIHHQFSSKAIQYINALLERESGVAMPDSLTVLEHYGNTASTSHFVTLRHHLASGAVAPGSKTLIVAEASGIVTGYMAIRTTTLKS